MTTFLTHCDSLARQLGRRATADHERDAIPNMRAAVATAACIAPLIVAAMVL